MKPCAVTFLFTVAFALQSLQLAEAQTNPPPRRTRLQRGRLTEKDYRFLEKEFRRGLEEVCLGGLAKERAHSQAVREFGERLVTESSEANDELKNLASESGAALSGKMTWLENSRLKHFRPESETSFDRVYAAEMLKERNGTVQDIQNAAKDLTDPGLRAWAQKTLAQFEEHRRSARNLEALLKDQR